MKAQACFNWGLSMTLVAAVIVLSSSIKASSGGKFEFGVCTSGERVSCKAKVLYPGDAEVVWEDSSGNVFKTRGGASFRQYDTYLLKLDPPPVGEEYYEIRDRSLLPTLWIVCSTSIPNKEWWVGDMLPLDTNYFHINEEVNGRRIKLEHGAEMGSPTYFASEGIGGKVWQITQQEAESYGWYGTCSGSMEVKP